jgi:hypothetical protein
MKKRKSKPVTKNFLRWSRKNPAGLKKSSSKKRTIKLTGLLPEQVPQPDGSVAPLLPVLPGFLCLQKPHFPKD